MTRVRWLFARLLVGIISAAALTSAHADFLGQHMVVANRGAGSISVIDVATHDVTTFPLPGGSNPAEPMYVSYSPANDLVFVGDRGNNRIVAFDARNYGVVASDIPAGAGIFHMWGSPVANQLWINNENSRTITVVDPVSFGNLTTLATPSDLGPNARPHDVILDPNGDFAYVTMIGADGPNDFVMKYSTSTFSEVDRQPVGKDPHVSLTSANNLLYVPTQNSDQLAVLDRTTLDPAMMPLPLFRAHGIAPTADGQVVYLSSFPGIAPATGMDGLHVMDTSTNTIVNSVDVPDMGAGPHNIALAFDNSRLFITHTGATSNTVSMYDVAGSNRMSPVLLTSVTVGTNPFGIAAIPAVPEPTSLVSLLLCALVGAVTRRPQPR